MEFIEIAKQYIAEYISAEFNDEIDPDFTNLSKIGLAYTTTEDDAHEIQVYANLIDCRIAVYVDNICFKDEQFTSVEEMLPSLRALDFNDLVYLEPDELEFIARNGVKPIIQPGEMYAAAIAALPSGDIDHHNSDLYLKRTPASQALIARLANRSLLTTFRDSDGVVWYELPFCFTPYWSNPYKYT